MMVNARVLSTLENGVMLSFLTYFTGTVSCVSLQHQLLTESMLKLNDNRTGSVYKVSFSVLSIYFSISILQVDIFHLQNSYPTTNWMEDYNQNKKVSVKTFGGKNGNINLNYIMYSCQLPSLVRLSLFSC
jgi:rRNA biogenesis protein RRP5